MFFLPEEKSSINKEAFRINQSLSFLIFLLFSLKKQQHVFSLINIKLADLLLHHVILQMAKKTLPKF